MKAFWRTFDPLTTTRLPFVSPSVAALIAQGDVALPVGAPGLSIAVTGMMFATAKSEGKRFIRHWAIPASMYARVGNELRFHKGGAFVMDTVDTYRVVASLIEWYVAGRGTYVDASTHEGPYYTTWGTFALRFDQCVITL